MGSFNVGCGMSNLSINLGDKVGFVILGESLKRAFTPANSTREAGKTCYVSATDEYVPFLPPIFGEYGDYGCIENIQPSVTTALLEKMFHRPVDVVMEALSSNRGIYDKHGDIFRHYYVGDAIMKKYTASVEEVLLALGFKSVPTDVLDAEEYMFEGHSIVKEAVWSIHDKAMLDRQLGTLNNYASVSEVLEAFGEVTGVYPGFNPEEYQAIRMLHRLSGMFFLQEIMNGMTTYMTESSHYGTTYVQRFTKDIEQFKQSLSIPVEDRNISHWDLPFREYVQRDMSFPVLYSEELCVYADAPYEFVTLDYLTDIMTLTNRMFIPTFSGTQVGDDDASMALNNITGEVLKERFRAIGTDEM